MKPEEQKNRAQWLPYIKVPAAGGLLKKRRRMWVIVIAIGAVAGATTLLLAMKVKSSGPAGKELSTFTVRRDNLVVKVTESGSIKALNTIEIKSQRERDAVVLSIVPEGAYITQEDVDNGKVLVELDKASLEEDLTQREIDLASAEASYTEAKESNEIQIKQNESDITAAELKVKFAMIDLKKYLGDSVAEKFVASAEDSSEGPIDIESLVEDPQLGGDALQKLRQLTEDINLKEQTYKLAESKLEWSQKLYEKKYISQTEMEADSLDKDRKQISWKQAQTAKELFIKYEFPKQAEQLLSDYNEAKRALDRTYASTRSKLAQAQARLKSAESNLEQRRERLNRTNKQIEVSTIKAPAPGLVTYGSSTEGMSRRWRQGPIEEGGTVREYQTIISLPDMTQMMAEIKVHESSVDKVRPAQKATIVMDAFPDKIFSGEVIKVAPLPDQQDNWLSPDLKVYKTEVSIAGTYDFLKPGMSAKVEILVERLDDVIIVPVQVVANRGGKKVCYVLGSGPEEREVQTGLFNDTFVQILEGLQVGEKVLLSPPKITGPVVQTSMPDSETVGTEQGVKERESQAEPGSQSQAPSQSQTEERQGRRRRGEIELTDEIIERTMDFLEQMNPEKAQELKRLRQSDPAGFKTELKKVMREQFEKVGRGEGGPRGRRRQDGDTTGQ
ncbi:MAG TPA: HlyD family efflux transporter periplasmic adaptor subunit [Planctomycetes bacterium]|nr:HlyD family efflux transporter periplasmic adaptor subunit [Planctomycetota bacterium]HIJ71613.1 HlyD family efflux transporter periplasmic adaptor subunit [Planctomycetota bacterium]